MNRVETLLSVATLGVMIGMVLVTIGSVRAKNAASIGLRAVLNVASTTLGFWALGAAILMSGSKLMGLEPKLLVGWDPVSARATLSYLVLAIIATGTLNGALAERTSLSVPAWSAAGVGTILMPLAGLWVWGGWLKSLGFVDIGGACVLHLTGGITAAVGVMMVGPRTGKYNRDGSSNVIPGFNIPWILLGALLTTICWSALVMQAGPDRGLAGPTVNVLLSASAAVLACVISSRLRTGKVDVLLTWSALLGGLVAISAGGEWIPGGGAVLIGAVCGVVVPWLTIQVDLRWKFDDPAGMVVPCVFGAFWGTLATGAMLMKDQAIPLIGWDRLTQIGVQILGVLVIAVMSLVLAWILFTLVKFTVGLRVAAAQEYEGMDLVEHDINAHPDFQQTMIKSYHTREA